jgi:hypothetical protein
MKCFFISFFLFIISACASGQGTPDSFVYHDAMMLNGDTVRVDSAQTAPKRRLLPENMSFLERGLWGEHGFLRSIGIASPLTPEARKSELSLRRTMLTMHQIGGFVTLGLMATTVYYGQKSLDNISSPNYRSYRNNHQTFVALTIGSYSLTGLLAILTPPPLIRRDEFSTTTLHKTLAWVHFVGMVVTPIIGASLHSRLNDDQRARFHQYSAYITTAALATSLIVITF